VTEGLSIERILLRQQACDVALMYLVFVYNNVTLYSALEVTALFTALDKLTILHYITYDQADPFQLFVSLPCVIITGCRLDPFTEISS